MVKTVIASDGRPIELTDIPFGLSEKDNIRYGSPVPVMARDEARANTTIKAAGFELAYDSRGYCYKRVEIKK